MINSYSCNNSSNIMKVAYATKEYERVLDFGCVGKSFILEHTQAIF